VGHTAVLGTMKLRAVLKSTDARKQLAIHAFGRRPHRRKKRNFLVDRGAFDQRTEAALPGEVRERWQLNRRRALGRHLTIRSSYYCR
jgi:hypothetical protein